MCRCIRRSAAGGLVVSAAAFSSFMGRLFLIFAAVAHVRSSSTGVRLFFFCLLSVVRCLLRQWHEMRWWGGSEPLEINDGAIGRHRHGRV